MRITRLRPGNEVLEVSSVVDLIQAGPSIVLCNVLETLN